ncbi:hypothetical protein NPIL_592001 [Nephila pilipes]|uniref:Uncharacterized protein n=1 Tax=Nephila pilipes TaxID=299642 RepID=A0A8X6PK20_NEPPI|nr:hypothetical protein NPIL_592001 [Nephila pilipes]
MNNVHYFLTEIFTQLCSKLPMHVKTPMTNQLEHQTSTGSLNFLPDPFHPHFSVGPVGVREGTDGLRQKVHNSWHTSSRQTGPKDSTLSWGVVGVVVGVTSTGCSAEKEMSAAICLNDRNFSTLLLIQPVVKDS